MYASADPIAGMSPKPGHLDPRSRLRTAGVTGGHVHGARLLRGGEGREGHVNIAADFDGCWRTAAMTFEVAVAKGQMYLFE